MDLAYVTKLAEDHWGYVEAVLEAHAVPGHVQRMCGFHYISAFIHGYKHAVEDEAQSVPSNEDWGDYMDYEDLLADVNVPTTQPVERPEVYGGGS